MKLNLQMLEERCYNVTDLTYKLQIFLYQLEFNKEIMLVPVSTLRRNLRLRIGDTASRYGG